MEYVKRPHAVNLTRWAEHNPQAVVFSADLTSSCEADDFRERYPQRFFSLGMAEQNMISFAGGMAREGFFPYVHTFAVFITRRAYDQTAMSVAYPNLPVRLLGFLPGVVTPGGVTHQAVDDVGLMRLLPNMRVLECGDATEVESVLDVAQAINGPVYVRMLRGDVPRLFPASQPMRFNQARILSPGNDIAVLSSGICTEEALRAVRALTDKGVSVRHLHISTLKPFDDPSVVETLETVRHGVITIENHSVIGGLGSATAELMAERGAGLRLLRFGLQDCYAQGASREYLMAQYGLDAAAVVRGAEKLLNQSFGITPHQLRVIEPAPVNPTAKAEDL